VIRGLKSAYLKLVRAAGEGVDPERMFDPENQQLVAGLADIAIEIFAAESVALRVAKARAAGADEIELLEALARIALARAAERARQEMGEILGALLSGDVLEARLAEVSTSLPLPPGLFEDRASVARKLLELGGLPAGEAQPVR